MTCVFGICHEVQWSFITNNWWWLTLYPSTPNLLLKYQAAHCHQSLQLVMRNAVLFLVSPVCRLITRPCWFLQHWEEVKQSATHTQPLRGDNRLQTHRQTLRSEGPAKTNHYDTLHSFFYSTAPCHRSSQSLLPRATLRTEKTNRRAVKPRTSPSWFHHAPHHVTDNLYSITTPPFILVVKFTLLIILHYIKW